MKVRIWLILFMAFGLIGLVVTEHIFVSDTINYLKTESISLKDEIFSSENINTDNLKIKIKTLDENWRKKENTLCLIVNHKDMEKVGEQIEKLKVLIEQDKKEEAEYEAQLLVYFVEGYEHFIAVSFQNIF